MIAEEQWKPVTTLGGAERESVEEAAVIHWEALCYVLGGFMPGVYIWSTGRGENSRSKGCGEITETPPSEGMACLV